MPVNPGIIRVESSFGYEDVEVATLGEHTLFGNPRLRGFLFSSFLPAHYSPSYCEYEDIPDPWTVIETIERWKGTRRPIRFTVTGPRSALLNVPVTIRTFNYEERGGQPGDWYFDIELKEYRFIRVRSITETAAGQSEASASVKVLSASGGRPSEWVPPNSYRVKSGDSLWKISAEVYRDGGVGWRKIYEANRDTIGKDPNLIRPGQTLVIPR